MFLWRPTRKNKRTIMPPGLASESQGPSLKRQYNPHVPWLYRSSWEKSDVHRSSIVSSRRARPGPLSPYHTRFGRSRRLSLHDGQARIIQGGRERKRNNCRLTCRRRELYFPDQGRCYESGRRHRWHKDVKGKEGVARPFLARFRDLWLLRAVPILVIEMQFISGGTRAERGTRMNVNNTEIQFKIERPP